MEILKVENLVKTYGKGENKVNAVDNISFSVQKGEFVANKVNNTLKFEEGVVGLARSDYSQTSPSLVDESYNSGCAQSLQH